MWKPALRAAANGSADLHNLRAGREYTQGGGAVSTLRKRNRKGNRDKDRKRKGTRKSLKTQEGDESEHTGRGKVSTHRKRIASDHVGRGGVSTHRKRNPVYTWKECKAQKAGAACRGLYLKCRHGHGLL